MLHLWPERLSMYLLPDSASIHVGSQLHSAIPAPVDFGARFAVIAQQLLPVAVKRSWLIPVLDIVLSDEMARLRLLQWQPRLRSGAQQQRYAEACFEADGLDCRDWLVQASYRQFGGSGLGLAVRREALAGLAEISALRKVRLRSALPVTAAAYWRHRASRSSHDILVLDEGRRLTSLCYAKGELCAIDVQQAGETRELALARLMRRCRATFPQASKLAYWSGASEAMADHLLTSVWPGISLRHLPYGAWR